MRILNETRYPHPVLSSFNDDYVNGGFAVEFEVAEDMSQGDLTLHYKISITEPDILALVETGQVAVGCIVRCMDTYYIRLHCFDYPVGRADFPAGDLINTVSLRPVVWVKESGLILTSSSVHSEFGKLSPLGAGDIIALDLESTISVGQAKLANAESIFQLSMSEEIPEGEYRVSLNYERIVISVAPAAYKTINNLRNHSDGGAIVMNSCYLPAVMEVLDILRDDSETYSGRRWYKPFTERCVFKGIDLNKDFSILEAAQALLEKPLATLTGVMGGGHE